MEWRVTFEKPALVGVRGAIKIISDFCRPLGLCPMSYAPVVKVSRALTIYTYCFLLPFYNTIYIISLPNWITQNIGNKYKFVSKASSFGLYVILTNAALLTAPSRIRDWTKHLLVMEQIILRTKVTDLKERIWAYGAIISIIISISYTAIVMVYMCIKFHNCDSASIWLSSAMLSIMTFMLQCTSFQFIFLVVRIHSAAVAVNTGLTSLLRENSDPTDLEGRNIFRNTYLISGRPKTPHHNGALRYRSSITCVRQLSQDFIALCRIVSRVSKKEQIVTILFIVAVMFRLMMSAYAATKNKIPDNVFSLDMVLYIIDIYWGVYMACIVTIILEPCERTYQQLDETKDLLERLKKQNNEVEFLNELNHFLRVTTLMNPRFTPFQIITLNRSLLAQILGGVATYVVTFSQIKV